MDHIYKQTLLYDFYGELLTEHQRTVYEDAVYNDMSLGEIAQERGISRQGVHDLIRRCDRLLAGYEDKLHLVQKFVEAKQKISRIVELTEDPAFERLDEQARRRLMDIREISGEIMQEF